MRIPLSLAMLACLVVIAGCTTPEVVTPTFETTGCWTVTWAYEFVANGPSRQMASRKRTSFSLEKNTKPPTTVPDFSQSSETTTSGIRSAIRRTPSSVT